MSARVAVYTEHPESRARGLEAAHRAQRAAREDARRLSGDQTGWWGPARAGQQERLNGFQAHAVATAIEATGRYWATADALGQGASWVIVRSRARPFLQVGACRYPGDETAFLGAPLPIGRTRTPEEKRATDRARSRRWHAAHKEANGAARRRRARGVAP